MAGSVSGTIAVYDINMDDLDEADELPKNEQVTLSRDGIIQLPQSYTTVDTMAGPSYGYDGQSPVRWTLCCPCLTQLRCAVGAGEQMTYDKAAKIAYVVGETGIMHVSVRTAAF